MKTTPLFTAWTVAIAALGITLALHGQNKDPFVKNQPAAAPNAKQAAERPQLNGMVGLLLEYVEVDHKDAVRLLREHGGALDSTKLRMELEDMIKANHAKLIDTVYVTARHGQRVRRESILEKIYPTEYDPPEIPQTMMLQTKEGEMKAPLPADAIFGIKTAANPTAFETRNIGVTFEVDGTIGQDGRTLHFTLAPEIVSFRGWRYYAPRNSPHDETKDIRMPKFQSMRTSTSINMSDGEHALLGCFNPRDAKGKCVLALLRANILK